MSTLTFLKTALESPGSKPVPAALKARDCSFWLIIVLLLNNCSLTTPGGETYFTGSRAPFS